MMKSATSRSIAAELFTKMSFQVGFVTLMVAVLQRTSRALPLGYISLAMIVPSLLFTALSGRIMARFQPLAAFRWASTARATLFGAVAGLGTEVWHFAAVAALSSLLQQVAATAKLTYDTRLVPPGRRARFNARRAFLASLSMIAGPAVGALMADRLGVGSAALLTAGLGLLGAILPARLDASPAEAATGPSCTAARPAMGALFRWLFKEHELLALVSVYVVVLAILEMEAPLVFPFVQEVYGRDSHLAGLLLGACGVGALAGSIVMDRHGKPLVVSAILLLLALDGASLYFATRGYPPSITMALFSALGVISAVALITVETQIQETAPVAYQPYLFSALSFAGGVGGAALTLLSTGLADIYGAASVLRGCALFEIALGACACLLLPLSKGLLRAREG